jgi:hypothetical protein
MGTPAKRKPITVKQVCLASFIPAVVGGIIGFSTGGPESAAIGFAEWLVAGFVILYVAASFVELLWK